MTYQLICVYSMEVASELQAQTEKNMKEAYFTEPMK